MAEEDSNLANYPVFADPNKLHLHQYLRKRETEQKIKAFNASKSVQLRYSPRVDIQGMV
jgi:L-rhamnose mutarotase